MTHPEAARGRDIVARWCNLAEQRLEYLTELFETGRWRRYHSEVAFLENIQEAKSAVEVWRGLSMRDGSLDNSAVDMSWLGRGKAPLPRTGPPDRRPLPRKIPAVPPSQAQAPVSALPRHVAPEEVPSAPAMGASGLGHHHEPTLDEIAQRYPLLRNAL